MTKNEESQLSPQPSVLSCIIPAYNEEGRVGDTVRTVLPYVDEVIVIDDASQDNTANEAQTAGARVLRQTHNQGYIAAIKRGFAEASGDIVVTLDADGELPADQIPALVRPILENKADMVQGRRDFIRRPSERILTWLAQQRAPVGDSGTGLRALRTTLARKLKLNGACICGIFSLEVSSKGGVIAEVPVRLHAIQKPRRIAWYHIKQLFYIFPWLIFRNI